MGERRHSLLPGFEFLTALEKDHTQLEYPPCTGPLKEVFERKLIPYNLPVELVVSEREFPASVNRYQISGPGDESIRLFFSNSQPRGVVLTLNPRRFEISVTIDVKREPIPRCDYGEAIMGLPEGMTLIDGKELLEVLKKGGGEVETRTFYFVDIRQIREFPIYSRPVYDPPPIQLPGEKTEAEAEPDWSIREVRVFSQRGLLPIINELDPAYGYSGRGKSGRFVSRSSPIVLRPKLKPAIEIAEMIVSNLDA